MGNDTSALTEALEAMTGGKPLRRLQSTELIRPMLSMLRYGAPVFDRAGKGAWRDMWRSMPPLALLGIVFKTLRIGSRT